MNIINIVEAASNTSQSTSVDICKNAANSLTSLGGIVNYISCFLVKFIIPLLMSLAVAGFIWGIIKYFINPDNEEQKKKGKDFMVWGLIALFVIVSMWGIVAIFSNTLGLRPVIPQLSNQL